MMEKHRRCKKMTSYKPHTAKIILLLMFTLALLPSISAWDWDNNLDYEKDDKVVVIENAFGLPIIGEVLGKAELTSHETVNEVRNVIAGKDVVTMYYDFYEWEEIYINGLGTVEFTDMKTGEAINKDYKFVVPVYKEITLDKYSKECYEVIAKNSSVVEVCEDVVSGTYKTTRLTGWEELTGKDIPKENTRIGIMVDVERGEHIDAVWTIAGKRVSKHGEWQDAWNIGLVAWWSMDDTSNVTNIKDDVSGVHNASGDGGFAYNTTGCIIGNCTTYDGNDKTNIANHIDLEPLNNITICAWIGANEGGFETIMTRSGHGAVLSYMLRKHTDEKITFRATADGGGVEPTGDTIMVGGEWYHACGTYNTTDISVYLNGTFEKLAAQTGNIDYTTVANALITIGWWDDAAGGNFFYAGDIDEVGFWNRSLSVTEIAGIHQAGRDGNSFRPTPPINPDVTIQSPTNTSFTNNVTNYSVTATDNVLIDSCHGTVDSGVTNFTLINSTSNDVYNRTRIEPDGSYHFEAFCNNSAGGINNTETVDFIIDIIAPEITLEHEALKDYQIRNTNYTINWTVTDANLDTCWYDYIGVNVTIVCSANTTGINIANINDRNLTFYANDSIGSESNSFIEWDYKIFENDITFNPVTFETEEETFTINVTANSSLTSAILDYNGTSQSSTSTGTNFSSTFDIPTGTQNKTFFWNFTYAGSVIQSNPQDQFINVTVFDLCNTSLSTAYINFTFVNETVSLESVNASIPSSTFLYYLGTGAINKTLTFSNASENPDYAFCLTPPDKTLQTIYSLAFTNSLSQQRSRQETITLINTTTSRVLYLLPNTLGLFSSFRVQDTVGNTLPLVSIVISRAISGVATTIATGITDGSGFATFFLNPNIAHTGAFSLTGFETNTFVFVPTSETRTVTMGSPVTVINGSEIALGTSYQIQPQNTSLQNDTDITFSFNVTSDRTITLISMNITNSSGHQLLFTSNAGTGFISGVRNTGQNKSLAGRFIIQTANETITIGRLWVIGDEFEGDYSLFRQLSLFTDYDFDDFWKLLIVISVIIGTLIFMSSSEVIESSESKIMVGLLIIWAFSIVGWLNNPAVASETGLSQFGRQYGIAILSTTGGVIFILRRVFIRRI